MSRPLVRALRRRGRGSPAEQADGADAGPERDLATAATEPGGPAPTQPPTAPTASEESLAAIPGEPASTQPATAPTAPEEPLAAPDPAGLAERPSEPHTRAISHAAQPTRDASQPTQELTRPPSEPGDPSAPPVAPWRQRGRLRRRLRYLRRARELALRDLGGLVFDLHRFGRERPDLVAGKLEALDAVDRERRALERVLDDHREVDVLREPGLASCPRCGALHPSEARFCSSCGMPVGLDAAPAAPRPVPDAAETIAP